MWQTFPEHPPCPAPCSVGPGEIQENDSSLSPGCSAQWENRTMNRERRCHSGAVGIPGGVIFGLEFEFSGKRRKGSLFQRPWSCKDGRVFRKENCLQGRADRGCKGAYQPFLILKGTWSHCRAWAGLMCQVCFQKDLWGSREVEGEQKTGRQVARLFPFQICPFKLKFLWCPPAGWTGEPLWSSSELHKPVCSGGRVGELCPSLLLANVITG